VEPEVQLEGARLLNTMQEDGLRTPPALHSVPTAMSDDNPRARIQAYQWRARTSSLNRATVRRPIKIGSDRRPSTARQVRPRIFFDVDALAARREVAPVVWSSSRLATARLPRRAH
jgi:hypothetical protein